MVEGVELIPLRRFEDERGWFLELMRESALPQAMTQTNLSFSRQGVIRGLHYHERGQDDLFACLSGTARVVVLDRESGETFTADIGDDNPAAVYIPGRHAHGFEALTDVLFCYHVTQEYDPAEPDEQGICWADPRVKHLWSTDSPLLVQPASARRASERRGSYGYFMIACSMRGHNRSLVEKKLSAALERPEDEARASASRSMACIRARRTRRSRSAGW